MENTIITKKPTKISFKQLFEFASHLPRIPEHGQQHKIYQFSVINEIECKWNAFPEESALVDIKTVNVRFNKNINDWELIF